MTTPFHETDDACGLARVRRSADGPATYLLTDLRLVSKLERMY